MKSVLFKSKRIQSILLISILLGNLSSFAVERVPSSSDRVSVIIQLTQRQKFDFSNGHQDSDGTTWKMYQSNPIPYFGKNIDISFRIIDGLKNSELPIAIETPKAILFRAKHRLFMKLPTSQLNYGSPIIFASESREGLLKIGRGKVMELFQFSPLENILSEGWKTSGVQEASWGAKKLFVAMNLYNPEEMAPLGGFYLPNRLSQIVSNNSFDDLLALSFGNKEIVRNILSRNPGTEANDWLRDTSIFSSYVRTTHKCIFIRNITPIKVDQKEKSLLCKQHSLIKVEYKRMVK